MKARLLDLFCGAGLAADGYAAAGWEVVGVDINPQPDYPFQVIQADAIEIMEAISGNRGDSSGRGWRGGVEVRADLPPTSREDQGRGGAKPELGSLSHPVDAIHASPPCQFLTRAKHLRKAQGGESKYPDLLTPTLELLRTLSIPWVVENVEGAKAYMQPKEGEYLARVCGSYFDLEVQRHRLFLSNFPLQGTACRHDTFPLDPITGKPRPWGVYHVPGDSIPKGGRTARDAGHARDLFRLGRDLPWDSIKEGFPPTYTRHIGSQLILSADSEKAA